MSLSPEIAQTIRDLGQRFDPDVARITRELAAPLHDPSVIAELPIDRDISYGPDSRQRLDIYGAGTAGELRPVVVYVHGGAFIGGDKSAADGAPFYENVGAWAIARGVACVAMTYRLAPANSWPKGSEDIASLIAWLHAEGHAHGLDSARIILMGQSAGAVHVATYLAKPELQQVRRGGVIAGILLSGLYDIAKAADNPPKLAYFGDDASLYAERSSLDGLVSYCEIPLLVGVCEYDPADFQQQAVLLLNALFERDGRLPRVIYQIGHNHLSSIYLLGSSEDTLGPPLGEFVRIVLDTTTN